jgi:hypothetical protein
MGIVTASISSVDSQACRVVGRIRTAGRGASNRFTSGVRSRPRRQVSVIRAISMSDRRRGGLARRAAPVSGRTGGSPAGASRMPFAAIVLVALLVAASVAAQFGLRALGQAFALAL